MGESGHVLLNTGLSLILSGIGAFIAWALNRYVRQNDEAFKGIERAFGEVEKDLIYLRGRSHDLLNALHVAALKIEFLERTSTNNPSEHDK